MENEKLNEQEEMEEKDVEVLEFSLDEDEIDELIAKLHELKETKTNFSFEVDDDNEIQINYEESIEDELGDIEE